MYALIPSPCKGPLANIYTRGGGGGVVICQTDQLTPLYCLLIFMMHAGSDFEQQAPKIKSHWLSLIAGDKQGDADAPQDKGGDEY